MSRKIHEWILENSSHVLKTDEQIVQVLSELLNKKQSIQNNTFDFHWK